MGGWGAGGPPDDVREFATGLARETVSRLDAIDRLIADTAERWRPERMADVVHHPHGDGGLHLTDQCHDIVAELPCPGKAKHGEVRVNVVMGRARGTG